MNSRIRMANLGEPSGVRDVFSHLSKEDACILEDQIRKNKKRTEDFIHLLDRLVNIEHYQKNHPKVSTIRGHMGLLMSENNTFRQNLWNYWLQLDSVPHHY